MILHDLTNCMRIGDVTVFGNDGIFKTIEVKTNPSRTSPAQKRRVNTGSTRSPDGPLQAHVAGRAGQKACLAGVRPCVGTYFGDVRD